MKRFFLIGLVIALVLSLGAIFYGAWLNGRGERQIVQRMAERRLTLHGARASAREIRPQVELSSVNIFSNDMADAVALIDGRIISCLVPKNGFVKKGDTIFVVANEGIPLQLQEAEANILEAEAALKQAESDYARYKMLKEHEATSMQQFEAAKAKYRSAQSKFTVAKSKFAQLRLQEARQNVTAPLDGKVIMQYRQPGTPVRAGTSLALVGDFSSLYFGMAIDDKDARHLTTGQKVELVFTDTDFPKAYSTSYAAGNLGNSQKFYAVLEEVTPPLSEKAEIRSALWKIDNRSGLLEPQLYGGVILQSLTGEKVLAVPLSAMADDAHASVFVASGGVIERRAVKTGTDDGTYIEILSGLSDGEVVVSAGLEGLTDGMQADVEVEDAKEGGGSK